MWMHVEILSQWPGVSLSLVEKFHEMQAVINRVQFTSEFDWKNFEMD